MNNFSKYAQMRNAGANARAVYLAAKADGIDGVRCIRLLREVFHLSLVDAKEVTIVADNMDSYLNEYQGHLKTGLEKALDIEALPEDNTTS